DCRLRGKSTIYNLQSTIPWRLLLLTSLATAALILTHYLVTALCALLIASYLLGLVLARRSWAAASVLALRAGLAAALALLLAAERDRRAFGAQCDRPCRRLIQGDRRRALCARAIGSQICRRRHADSGAGRAAGGAVAARMARCAIGGLVRAAGDRSCAIYGG